jgi:hypothetical protein
MVQSVTIILESLSHPKKLYTTTPRCNILCFGRGSGNAILFLGRLTH